MVRSKESLTYAPTREEYRKMLTFAKDGKLQKGQRHYLMIAIQYNCILRINEVLKIRFPKDVADEMIYCQAWKNNDSRWRKAPQWLIDEIKEYAKKNKINGELFPISETMAERTVRRIAELAGVQRTRSRSVTTKDGEVEQTKYYITTHSLRAAGVTHAIQAGANAESVRQYGGWKTREAFERYIKTIVTEKDINLLHNLER